nr:hypothetical protein Iba_chr04dCG9830 [Ipomoea batatas]
MKRERESKVELKKRRGNNLQVTTESLYMAFRIAIGFFIFKTEPRKGNQGKVQLCKSQSAKGCDASKPAPPFVVFFWAQPFG